MGRRFKATVSSVLVVILLLICGSPVLAYSSPDNWEIHSKKIFRHTVQPNDFLLVFNYEITYNATAPDKSADYLFMFSMLTDNATVDFQDTRIFPYHESGYGYGIGYMYWDNTTAPPWNQPYLLRIMEDPSAFPAPTHVYNDITADDYDTSADQADARLALGNYLISALTVVGTEWDTQLVAFTDAGNILTSTGELYLRAAIPGIGYIVPQLLSIQTTATGPLTDNQTAYVPVLYQNQYTGTWVQDSLDALGDLFHGANTLVIGAIMLVLWVFLAGYSQKKWQRSEPGFILGALVFIGVSILGGSWQMLALGIVGCGAYGAWIFQGDRT